MSFGNLILWPLERAGCYGELASKGASTVSVTKFDSLTAYDFLINVPVVIILSKCVFLLFLGTCSLVNVLLQRNEICPHPIVFR